MSNEAIQPILQIQPANEIQPADAVQLADAVQPADEISPTSRNIDEWVIQIKARLANPDTSHSINSNRERCPSIVGKWKCLDDFGVSFLPETKGWQFVEYMEKYFGLKVRSFLEHIQENEDLVWSYYNGVHEQFRTAENSKRFIEHLLTNSCFLIFAMVIISLNGDLMDHLGANAITAVDPKSIHFRNLFQFIKQNLMSIKQYMLTMDYQIPLFVVEAVYEHQSNLRKLLNIPIGKLAVSCFAEIFPEMHNSKMAYQYNDNINNLLPTSGFKHLLHIFHWSRIPEGKFLKPDAWTLNMDSFYIPSATDLKLSETVFEKHAGGSIDVDYSKRRFSGVMQLAPLHIFPYSIKIYESLLRFERGYKQCGLPFTAYVACMVCLLHTESDVKLLQTNGIVPTTKNNENDVLSYIQKLKTFLDDDVPMSANLENLSVMVKARHAKNSFRCYGEFKSRYCRNPWITISLIVGFLLFLLTIMQTVLSFIQTI